MPAGWFQQDPSNPTKQIGRSVSLHGVPAARFVPFVGSAMAPALRCAHISNTNATTLISSRSESRSFGNLGITSPLSPGLLIALIFLAIW